MTANAFHECMLIAVSGATALTLGIAWVDLDRPRHALTWAVAFALLSAAWAAQLTVEFGIDPLAGRIAATAMAALAAAVNAVGFRQRASRPDRAVPLILAALLVPAATLALGRAAPLAVALMPLELFTAATLAIAATMLTGRRRSERTAQRIALVAMVALAAASAGLFVAKAGALAFGRPLLLDGMPAALLPLLPVGVIAIGLFTIFLLVADLADQTRRLALTDPLTGLLNRRGFEQAARAVLEAAATGGRQATLALIDLDHFKAINDDLGHPAGDAVLRRFAAVLQEHAARRDLATRLGGEEFALLMVDLDLAAAGCAAEVLRAAIETAPFALADRRTVTASFGLAEALDGPDLATLVDRADRALYEAKQTGRNRVVLCAD